MVALTALGAAVLTFVTRGEAVPPDPVRFVLCAGTASAFGLAGVAEWVLVPRAEVSHRTARIWLLHGAPALAALAVGAVGYRLGAIPLLVALDVITIVAVGTGEDWRRRFIPPAESEV
jgi:hypothetical protein